MSNEKEGSTVFSYKAPAIMITERNEDNEKVLEFATAEDYAAYKRIEAESMMSDNHKSVNVNINSMDKEKAKEIAMIVQSAIDSAELRCRRM